MTLHTYPDLQQGTDEWLEVRRGIITASTIGQLITATPPSPIAGACPECGSDPGMPCVSRSRKDAAPIKTLHASRTAPAGTPDTLTVADNDTSRALTLTLAAERITGWVEPAYVNQDMLRGQLDEPLARDKYAEHYAPVTELGFMVRTFGAQTADDPDPYRIGYSPDGLVGNDGLIEVKSRKPKKHLQTILTDTVPAENMAQIQTGLLVSGRQWCDYISWCGGMPIWTIRVHPDPRWHDTIIAAALTFEEKATAIVTAYDRATAGLPTTERIDHFAEIEI